MLYPARSDWDDCLSLLRDVLLEHGSLESCTILSKGLPLHYLHLLCVNCSGRGLAFFSLAACSLAASNNECPPLFIKKMEAHT